FGGTRSATWCFARLRYLASSRPSRSLTTTSVDPASLRLATMFDPMNPAPPVTKNIPALATRWPQDRTFAPARRPAQILRCFKVKIAAGQAPVAQGNGCPAASARDNGCAAPVDEPERQARCCPAGAHRSLCLDR